MKWRQDYEGIIAEWLGVTSFILPDNVYVPEAKIIKAADIVEERGSGMQT